jgi:hypothetical protein
MGDQNINAAFTEETGINNSSTVFEKK